MASISVPVSDEKILEHLQQQRGLNPGSGRVESIEVMAQPPAQNSDVSHVVTVQLRFGLRLGEVEELIGF